MNIKILLDSLVRSQLLPTQERNPLLASMSDDVAALVLADNIAQNALLGISRVTASQMLGVHRRQLTDLTKARGLDRKLEALPTDKEIERRLEAGVGLTSPELATLTAHVKLSLKDDLLATELPDNDFFAQQIPQYFPDRCSRSVRNGDQGTPVAAADRRDDARERSDRQRRNHVRLPLGRGDRSEQYGLDPCLRRCARGVCARRGVVANPARRASVQRSKTS